MPGVFPDYKAPIVRSGTNGNETRTFAGFAGIWTNWTSVRKVQEGETTNDIFAFHDRAERRDRRHSSEGDASDPDDIGRGRDLGDRACGPETAPTYRT